MSTLSAYECETYDAARHLNGGYDFIFVRGRTSTGDGGEGYFYWASGDGTHDNDGTILRPSTSPSGNWRRVYEQLISVRWFGARGDGNDATSAINAAIAVANKPEPFLVGMTVLLPVGNYVVSSGLTPIKRDNTHLRGAGCNATIIQFSAAAGACVTFRKDAGDPIPNLYTCSIRDIGFAASGSTGPGEKIAIDAWITSDLLIENVNVNYWNSTHPPSIAIQTNGHETTVIRRATLYADRPISIRKNPDDPYIDADHFHFEDLNLFAQKSFESCIVIASTVHLFNFTMTGTNALMGGTNGIEFVDTSFDHDSCLNINIENIRREQSAEGTTGYVVKFGMWGRQMLNVSLRNVAADLSPSNGFYFRNVRVLSLENCTYAGTATALDIHGTKDQSNLAPLYAGCWDVALLNTFFQTGSKIKATDMVRVLALQRYNTSYPPFMWFDTITNVANGQLPGIEIGGTVSDADGSISAQVKVLTGTGAPAVDAPPGSLYLNQAGGAGTTLYVKEGAGVLGWKVSGAGGWRLTDIRWADTVLGADPPAPRTGTLATQDRSAFGAQTGTSAHPGKT